MPLPLSFARTLALYIALLAVCPARASIYYESAALGLTGQATGISLTDSLFAGVRFDVTTTLFVDSVGGHLFSTFDGGLFAALVKLASPTAYPVGIPFDTSELVAGAVFTPPTDSSADVTIPLTATLTPGTYALIFGSGELGATGQGGMPVNNTQIGAPSYISIDSFGNWTNGGIADTRFFVSGVTTPPSGHAPEPIGLLIWFGLAAASSLASARSRLAD